VWSFSENPQALHHRAIIGDKMRIQSFLPAALLPLAVYAQNETPSASESAVASASASESESGQTLTGIFSAATSGPAVGDVAQTTNLTYISYDSTITRSANAALSTGNTTSNGTSSSDITNLVGGTRTLLGNSSATASTTAALPSNTQPCNGYVEFCDRQYSNITYVAAHNFPFIRENNAARNQELGMLDQLNDGIRMLQAQSHYVNDTMYLCHSDCDILNAGTLEDQFSLLVNWLEQNPYEVVTILLGNFFQGPVEQFLPAVQNSGLQRYLYIPPLIPMARGDWPTTSELIITGKRVIFFIDYMANPEVVPFILDEFSQIWETPFSPQDPAFPCTVDRPPQLNPEQADSRMYLVNHNLNVDLNALGINILVPDVVNINQTNGVSGESSLGLNAEQCTGEYCASLVPVTQG
jgi:hypothetical protein